MRIIVLISVICGLFFQALAHAAPTNCEQQYCVGVVDVGSSGSRLHVFSYDLDKTNSPIAITERWSKKIKPGLSTIEPDVAGIDNYLTQLFSDAPQYRFPVYFYATAGMRLLSQPKQQRYYDLVQTWFATHTDWKLISAKTITGADEGLYGWLAVNYQLNTLQNEKDPVGVMDMGGASVQISFPVKNTAEEINDKNTQIIDLYGHHYTVFTHSFLGLGQNETAHQFFNSTACFITNYVMPAGVFAEGDVYSCKNEVSRLVTSVHQVQAIIQPVIQANPIKHWYALGGVVDLVKSKPFVFSEQKFTNQALLEQADAEVCRQQWPALSSEYPNNEYLYGYCLFSAYYYALMVEGYGLQPQQPLNYLNAAQANDWAMGVVLKYPKV